jgi:hypothetical protein
MPCRLIRSEAKVDSPDVTVVAEFRRGSMLRPLSLRWGGGRATGVGPQTGKLLAWSAVGPQRTNASGCGASGSEER